MIEQRAMREWTQIGFSSIYFVLGRLQDLGLVSSRKPAGTKAGAKARKVYAITRAGRRTLATQTAALRDVRTTRAEAEWIASTIAYMSTRPWLD